MPQGRNTTAKRGGFQHGKKKKKNLTCSMLKQPWCSSDWSDVSQLASG